MSNRAKYVTCPDCDGSGWLDEDGDPAVVGIDDHEECNTCGGRGEVLEEG